MDFRFHSLFFNPVCRFMPKQTTF